MRAAPSQAWPGAARRAPEEEIAKSVAALAASGGKEPWLLSIFARRRSPLDPARLLAWAESPDADPSRRAQVALGHVTHPAVRELALRLPSNRGNGPGLAERGLHLLVS